MPTKKKKVVAKTARVSNKQRQTKKVKTNDKQIVSDAVVNKWLVELFKANYEYSLLSLSKYLPFRPLKKTFVSEIETIVKESNAILDEARKHPIDYGEQVLPNNNSKFSLKSPTADSVRRLPNSFLKSLVEWYEHDGILQTKNEVRQRLVEWFASTIGEQSFLWDNNGFFIDDTMIRCGKCVMGEKLHPIADKLYKEYLKRIEHLIKGTTTRGTKRCKKGMKCN